MEVDLKAVDAAGDEECLTYETTTGDFEWESCVESGASLFTLSDGSASEAITAGDTTQLPTALIAVAAVQLLVALLCLGLRQQPSLALAR